MHTETLHHPQNIERVRSCTTSHSVHGRSLCMLHIIQKLTRHERERQTWTNQKNTSRKGPTLRRVRICVDFETIERSGNIAGSASEMPTNEATSWIFSDFRARFCKLIHLSTSGVRLPGSALLLEFISGLYFWTLFLDFISGVYFSTLLLPKEEV